MSCSHPRQYDAATRKDSGYVGTSGGLFCAYPHCGSSIDSGRYFSTCASNWTRRARIGDRWFWIPEGWNERGERLP